MKEQNNFLLGIDIGSVSVNTVLMSEGKIIFEDYTRIKEQPAATVLKILKQLFTKFDQNLVKSAGVTGNGGKTIAQIINGTFVNEIVAHAKSTGYFYPQARTVIDIGGEDAKMILLRLDAKTGSMIMEGFSMNTICAAGTGSFLDQQASRLGVSIENEFGELAMKSQTPPRIAGRCSVFAKTDMIHLQQQGTPDYDIIAGLCFALARTFRSNICKCKEIKPPVLFHGGVAANTGMVRAFREILALDEKSFIVPGSHASMGAAGAAIIAGEKMKKFAGISGMEEYLRSPAKARRKLPPLALNPGFEDENVVTSGPSPTNNPGRANPEEGFMGIDVGSISTNVVVIDINGALLSRCYLPTAGRPIEAVRAGIKETGKKLGSRVAIRGVGTTGSGRYLIGEFVGADIVKNEITAQATASIALEPRVDTIFEIGGQDSKYISIENGAIVDFEMNKVCAAGTGSFLEEQAERLGFDIREEFACKALCAQEPVLLGERCTVFMETDLAHQRQAMASKEDLSAGLCYSIAQNYLNRVVGRKKIGNNIFFQGAVALNKGVVAAFEKVLGKKIKVPPNNDVTGAIGVALVARDESSGWNKSRFKGWEKIVETSYKLRSFECLDCPNRCEIREIKTEGSRPLYYGSRCEKYNVDRHEKQKSNLPPDLFAEREEYLLAAAEEGNKGTKGTVGLPRALVFHDMLPFWKAFFNRLGFRVILSGKTNKTTVRTGLDKVVEETCFPVKVAHGHIAELVSMKPDFIFLPMIVNMESKNPHMHQSFNCPYVQTLPFMAESAFNFQEEGIKLLKPVIAFAWGHNFARKTLMKLGRETGASTRETGEAIGAAEKAQSDFQSLLRKRGREVLDNLPEGRIPIVIVSRSYNGCDSGINLNLPGSLMSLGAYPIPLDYLPLDNVDISQEWPSMYWRCGQKILAAASIIRKDKHLQCLYITNFGCGPDSFIMHFFRETMKGKPFLEMEVDEHSADVGAITRCEAFMDSIKNVIKKPLPASTPGKAFVPLQRSATERTFYLPDMGDVSLALQAALKAEGVAAELYPKSTEETLALGRKYTCGKECYPCIITTGDMLRIVHSDGFNPDGAVFFMPSAMGPCRFGQYNRLQRMILDELGFEKVPIISPNQVNNLKDELSICGKSVFRNAWRGIVAIDILGHMVRKTRPYEVEPGEADKVYRKSLDMVIEALEKKQVPRDAVSKASQLFASVKVSDGKKPVVGIVGEIFVRSNEFSNNYLVHNIERLGAEVWLASVSEWFLHVNRTVCMHNSVRRQYIALLLNSLTGFVQTRDEKLIHAAAAEYLEHDEPPVAKIWQNASPYLPGWFGETALSMGRSRDYIEKGVSGIINVMPFTCLPGTIASTLFKQFAENNGNIPCITMAYDGLEQGNTEMRLESFIYQVSQYKNLHDNIANPGK